jgi:hypothetical protein
MGHSNAPEAAASTVPVRLGWLHASNVWLVARQEKVLRVNCTTPLNTDSNAEYRLLVHYSTKH